MTPSASTITPTMGRPQKQPDTSTYSGRVGAAIRARREALGLTPKELSERLARHGVKLGPRVLYAYEQGTRDMKWDHVPAVCKALGISSIHDLLPKK